MKADRTVYDEKLDAILHAAAALFAQKGYHDASIRDIARATGVSLSGLYYYFESKEELLYLIQDHTLEVLLEKLEARLEGESDPQRRLEILIENHLTFFSNNMAEMKVMSHEASSLSGEFHARVLAKKRRLAEVTSQMLRDLSPREQYDTRVATFALFGMMNWLYTWYRPERDVPIQRVVQDITRMFLHGYLQGPASECAETTTAPFWTERDDR